VRLTAALGLLLLSAGALMASDAEVVSPALRAEAARLEAKIDRVADADAALRDDMTRGILNESRERLIEAGLGEPLARALVPYASEEDIPPVVRLRRHRGKLLRLADAAERAPSGVSGESRERLESILDQPMFVDSAPEAGVLQRVQHWIRNKVFGLLNLVSNIVSANPALAIVLFSLVLAGAVFGIGVLIARSVGSRAGPSASEEFVISEPATPDVLPTVLARARAEARAGRRIKALELLVLAATLALRARGSLPDEPGLTDREGLRILEDSGPAEVRSDFRELTRLHESGVYGGQGVDDPLVELASRLAGRLVSHTPRTAA